MKKTLKIIIVSTLVVMAAGQEAQAAKVAKKVEVMLKGQAQAITGYLREISQTRYILQGDDRFYEFGADELITVNGNKTPSDRDLGEGRLIYRTLYEKILPNGDVEVWSNLDVENSGNKLIDSVDWGAAQWELEEIQTMEVVGQFGSKLPVSITPRSSGGYKVEVRLSVPVVPMESISIKVKILRKGAARELASGQWSYTFNCDFPEDRFFVRKVEFPAGSEIVVPAGWRRIELAGRVYLHSHFYYPALTVVPQVIEYRGP